MSRNILKEILSGDDDFIRNTFEKMNHKQFKEFCSNAMLQQDRDTRHACAEAVIHKTDKIKVRNLDDAVIYPYEASRVIINCGDGIK